MFKQKQQLTTEKFKQQKLPAIKNVLHEIMAEREGFEPSVPFPVHSISNATQSAALSSLHIKSFYKLSPETR